MPKIKSFAPGWLNEPSPGHKLFELTPEDNKLPASLAFSRKAKPGPRRTIARRGTEVFVAVGKQIRWGNLAALKETWESKQTRTTTPFEIYDEEAGGEHAALADGYRVCAPLVK